MTTTVATAVTALRERLDEATASAWTDIQLRRWLNEGLRDIARRTKCYWDTDSIAVSANDGLYTADSDVIEIRYAFFTPTADTTRNIPLDPVQYEGMQARWGVYQTQATSDPAFITTYGYPPSLQVQLWPVPYRAGTLTLHVARMPAAINVDAGGGSIDAPEPWIELCYDYCEYRAWRKERQTEDAQQALALYEAGIQRLIENMDSLNAPHEVVYDGASVVPRWIADFDW